ncbi:hypothetical protein EDD18DRAFT_1111720 [Armillaria luteobubalina]|uniref:C2H2-type domain-containing protein n=1 Tax=Armillaria luteobubalina TaxID=153913 RepID=A0AA39PHF0_9AGAR|nr:hypothetical protein EDD18DRAFT_1111720 [Armillaria luteobubalina]
MTLVSEYDAEFNSWVCFPDEDQGVDDSHLLLFSDEIDGSFLGREVTYDDEILFREACLSPPSGLFDAEPYAHSSCLAPPLKFGSELYTHHACLTPSSLLDSEPHSCDSWSPARYSDLTDRYYLAMEYYTSPEIVDPAVLTGPIPPISLPSSSSTSSPCTAQDPALMTPSEGTPSPVPTFRHVRPRYSHQAKAIVPSYFEGMDSGDEYEGKGDTHSPKRSRRSLSTPELVSDTSSASSTPLTLLATPISGTLPPRPTRSLPRRTVKKHVPAADQGLDSADSNDSHLRGKSKKVHRARGSGKLECYFPGCIVRFQREPERKRHYRHYHSRNPPKNVICEHCKGKLSRKDSVTRHIDKCPSLHPHVAKRRGVMAGKAEVDQKKDFIVFEYYSIVFNTCFHVVIFCYISAVSKLLPYHD